MPNSTRFTIQGYFKPEEWTDADGKALDRVTFVATKSCPATDKKQNEGQSQSSLLHFLPLCPISHPVFILVPQFIPYLCPVLHARIKPCHTWCCVKTPHRNTVNSQPQQLNNKTLK